MSAHSHPLPQLAALKLSYPKLHLGAFKSAPRVWFSQWSLKVVVENVLQVPGPDTDHEQSHRLAVFGPVGVYSLSVPTLSEFCFGYA